MPTLEAGRELDALIAEKVMGWRFIPLKSNSEQRALLPPGSNSETADIRPGHNLNERVPAYSTDIAAAWQVAEKFAFANVQRIEGSYSAVLRSDATDRVHEQWGWAETAPLAICRAAIA